MQRFSSHVLISLFVDCALLALCLFNAPTVLERAGTPFTARQINRQPVVDKVTDPHSAGSLEHGDVVLRWNADTVSVAEMFEFLGDLSSIGEHATITYERNGIVRTTDIRLVPYYESARFLIISLCVGFITWVIAIFILFNRAVNHAAVLLHWALIAFAVAIMITWGRTDPGSILPLFSRGVFFLSYTMIPTLFLLFTTTYPKHKLGTLRQKSAVIIPLAIVLIAGQTYYHLTALYRHSLGDFNAFQHWFDMFNVYLLVSIAGCIASLVHSYRSAYRSEDKRRLEWIMWGFCLSPVPFLLLIKLPQLIDSTAGLLPEEYTTIFFLLIPFSFTVSLIRYNVMDIQLVISRSIVSIILTILIGAIYAVTVLLAASSLETESRFREFMYAGVVIVAIGLLLNPVRKRLQRFFDEVLFPARTNFRKAVADITAALYECLTPDAVYSTVSSHIQKSIPFERLALYEYSSDALLLKASTGDTFPPMIDLSNDDAATLREYSPEYARERRLESISPVQRMIGCTVCCPLLGESKTLLGIAGGTPLETARRLHEEELDLFAAFCREAGETLGHLLLQEKIIIQNEENRRLQELSSLKSYFVSSVSHELRTPLTSIRMFAEMAQNHRLSKRKQHEYLGIVQGESERLSRLVDNVLDFSAIERGKKEYLREPCDLHEVITRSISAMRYLFEKEKVVFSASVPKRLPTLSLDADAMEEVFINLFSNALKYSTGKKHVGLVVRKRKTDIFIEISDNGIGIPKKEQRNIFDNFYRVTDPQTRQAGGAGLGLALVKQIVEFHGGNIRVRSTTGKGSTFIIGLPIQKRSV